MTTRPAQLLVRCVFILSFVTVSAPQWVWSQEQSLFVAYTDSEGEPVTDMEAKNIIIQWDEIDCEIIEVEPINWPLRVTVLVDTGTEAGSRLAHMRNGLESFLNILPPGIEVAIASTGGARTHYKTKHTSDKEELLSAVGRLVPDRGSSAFFDGLYEAAEEIGDDRNGEYFPVVVMVAVGGAEGSNRDRGSASQQAMENLNASGGTVHTLLLTGVSGPGQRSSGRKQAQWGTDFAAATRGTYQQLGDPTLFRTKLPELAEKLGQKHALVSNQYRITYKPPRDASDQPRIQMTTNRPGLRMFPTDNGNISQ